MLLREAASPAGRKLFRLMPRSWPALFDLFVRELS
jgi:hypothetical protein